MLGLICYLPKEAFSRLLETLARLLPDGSSLCFDYPEKTYGGRQRALADAAGEPMQEGFSAGEMEMMLSQSGFLSYEHIGAESMTAQYFAHFNRETGKNLAAPSGVRYLLAVRRRER